jgi:hypothetical protein
MMQLKHENKITFFVVSTFIAQPLLSILAAVIYPPDFSKEFPVYDPNSIMLIVCGNALGIAGLTVLGIKLADEKKILSSAGFTMLAISMGILLVSMFEISQVVSREAYEKFYRIQASGNFLYLPSMYLISAYEDFKKWIRYIGLVSSLVLLIASFMFLFGSRDFKTLEMISNIGFLFMFITFFSWAYNVYINYKRVQNKMEKN